MKFSQRKKGSRQIIAKLSQMNDHAHQSHLLRRYEHDPRIFADDARWLYLVLTFIVTIFYWNRQVFIPFRLDALWSLGVWLLYLPIRTVIRSTCRTPKWLVYVDALIMIINMYWWKWLPVSVPLLSVIITWEAVWSLPFMQALVVSGGLGLGYIITTFIAPIIPQEGPSSLFIAPFYPLVTILSYFLRRQMGLYESLAGTDYLTGLFNRRQLLQTYRQHGSSRWWVVLLDLDNFKQINDRFGHLMGDMVLRDLGRLIRQLFRAGEITARYGGEEFLILLPAELDRSVIAERLLRLNERLKDLSLRYPTPITLSGGIALSREDNEPLSDIIARADQALYQAKSQGKDQTVWAKDIVASPPA
ncbi:MAG: hypothetical protein C7B47_12630 [Sulfobacillus thermosulfidooxidans]|uniref:GGDEF domain-containing protein n=1 Tax=Sulfobacillus thermosulfidooxidans TaxID=28034 RepID=A0A2T2WSP9_SULTH|nr:MAG: hypothetical protein C7B47_12630 [Sulfobacillus thermosulfidooxidans]